MAITTLDLLKIEAWLLPRIAKAAKGGGGGTDLTPRVEALETLTQSMEGDINTIEDVNDRQDTDIGNLEDGIRATNRHIVEVRHLVTDLATDVAGIGTLIPNNASESNKLATMEDINDNVFIVSPNVTPYVQITSAMRDNKIILLALDNGLMATVTEYKEDNPGGYAFMRYVDYNTTDDQYTLNEFRVTSGDEWSTLVTMLPYPTAGDNIVIDPGLVINAYSDYDLGQDTIVGRWFEPDIPDGTFNIYRKVVSVGQLPSEGSMTVPHDLPEGFKIVNMHGIATSYNNNLPIPNTGTGAGAGENAIYLGIGPRNITIGVGKDRSAFTRCYVFIEYYIQPT